MKQKAMQSIKQALRDPGIVRALNGLVGCPVGGWGETQQARLRLLEELPPRSERAYTASQLIDAALIEVGETANACGRYAWRESA